MNKLQVELQKKTERAVHDMISRDTGKDAGDFGGEFGLVEWLITEGFEDHVKLLLSLPDKEHLMTVYVKYFYKSIN